MNDKYRNFYELIQNEEEGRDFRVNIVDRGSSTVIVAPHGGGIEPGTTDIAKAIAGDDLSLYTFDGLRPHGNRSLHITSTRFDEPRCVDLVRASERTVGVHGEKSPNRVVFLGGRDTETLERLQMSLERRGFKVGRHRNPALQGCDPRNLCNRSKLGAGVQLELSHGLRRSFLKSRPKAGRRLITQRLRDFAAAVREAIL